MQGDVSQRVHELLLRAAQQHRGGQLFEAARLYRQVLDIDPRQADALHLLGVVSLQRGHHGQAIDLINRAIAINAGVPAFHNNLGNALRARGQLALSADAFQRALSLNAQAPDTLYNLAVVLQQLGRHDEASAAYENVLLARPEHAAARSNLGNILYALGRYDDALGCFEAALRSQPDFLPALVNRGNVLSALGRLDEAMHCYRGALTINPRDAPAHNNLGLALLAADRPDDAIAAYRNALTVDPAYAEAHRNLGHALRERGRAAESAASYQQALSFDQNDAEARLGLAMASIPVFADTLAQSSAATGRLPAGPGGTGRLGGRSAGAAGPGCRPHAAVLSCVSPRGHHLAPGPLRAPGLPGRGRGRQGCARVRRFVGDPDRSSAHGRGERARACVSTRCGRCCCEASSSTCRASSWRLLFITRARRWTMRPDGPACGSTTSCRVRSRRRPGSSGCKPTGRTSFSIRRSAWIRSPVRSRRSGWRPCRSPRGDIR